MSDASPRHENLVSHYRSAFAAVAAPAPSLEQLRARAFDCFAELGLPTRRLEEWRYTNVTSLARTLYEPASACSGPETLDDLRLPDLGGDRIVFVDGHHSARLSNIDDSSGLEFRSLVGDHESAQIPTEFANIAEFKDDAFTALNTAWSRDVAILDIARSSALPRPIHLLFLSTPAPDSPRVSFPRVLIRAGAGSQARVVEDHVCLVDGTPAPPTLSVSVSEIVLEKDAGLELVLLNRGSASSNQIARQRIRQGRDSRLTFRSFNLGGAIVRNDLGIVLADPGAECELQGLTLGDADQIVDDHTLVDHAMPHCTSRELYKGVYGGESTGVFRGRVIVRPDAQHTAAEQQNRNLLLSRKAEVDTKPQLEIYADDVRCSHGSSIGQLDPDALFFMRSRGLDDSTARALLSEGFANEVTDFLPEDELGVWVRTLVIARLDELFAGGRRS